MVGESMSALAPIRRARLGGSLSFLYLASTIILTTNPAAGAEDVAKFQSICALRDGFGRCMRWSVGNNWMEGSVLGSAPPVPTFKTYTQAEVDVLVEHTSRTLQQQIDALNGSLKTSADMLDALTNRLNHLEAKQ